MASEKCGGRGWLDWLGEWGGETGGTKCGFEREDGKRELTGDLFLCKLVKVVHLALIRGPTPVPEKQPLKRFIPFELVFEAKLVILVRKFKQVE